MQFIRVFQHLLPDARAWRLTLGTTIRQFFEALSDAPQKIREFADLVHRDAFPTTTRELAAWQDQFGLEARGNDLQQRNALAAVWASSGGQSPHYIQTGLQTAGYNGFVHEWWSSGPPTYVARDPRLYTDEVLLGDFQCAPAGPDQPLCTGFGVGNVPPLEQPQCDRSLVNDPGYIVNKDLTRRAPPPIPDDPQYWPYFLYIGGPVFPNPATIPLSRREDFERLILKIHPSQQWLVLLIDYSATGIFDDTFDATFE